MSVETGGCEMTRRFPNVVCELFFATLIVASCANSDYGSDGGGDGSGGADGSSRTVQTLDESCEVVSSGFGPDGNVAIRVETLVSGLDVPWAIGFISKSDFLVSERNGNVRIVRKGVLAARPVVSINDAITRSEGGLLGLAIDPQFSSNRFFYVYYTAQNSVGEEVNRIERFRLSGDGTTASSDRVILDNIPASSRHDGGRMRFGPDGFLYVGTGDATVPSLSQDLKSPAGKILRMTPSGGAVAGNLAGIVYAAGIRNVQGFDWLDSNTMVVADHGPSGELGRSGHDELSFVRARDNLGWPNQWRCDEAQGRRRPMLVWQIALPPGGLVIAKGSAVPEWNGSALIATLRSQHLQRVILEVSPGGVARQTGNEVYLRGSFGRLREIVQAPDGSFLVTTSNCDGRGSCGAERDRILRITKE